MSRPGIMVIILFMLAPTMLASTEDSRHDYSKETLLLILRDSERDTVVEKAVETMTIRSGSWIYRLFPLVAPVRISGGEFGSASPFPPVSPFRLLGMDFPGGEPDTPRDGWTASERSYRKRMINRVRSMNASDNRR